MRRDRFLSVLLIAALCLCQPFTALADEDPSDAVNAETVLECAPQEAPASEAEVIEEASSETAVPEEAPPCPASDGASASGSCGSGLTWSLSDDGILTITGTADAGDMTSHPWSAKSVKKVLIGSGVKGLCDEAFKGCTNLTAVDLGDTLKEIGYQAFSGCTSLTEVAIPASVTYIGYGVFQGCTKLTGLTAAEGNTTYHSAGNCIIRTADKALIAGCKTSVIPADGSVTTIAGDAFYECTGLTQITIPDSIETIEMRAFYGCTGLSELILPDSVTTVETEAFKGCSGLTSLTLSNGMTSIEGWTFAWCTELTEVTIPTGVRAISGNAFSDCHKLGSVTIPVSVNSIETSSFQSCSSLQDIYYGGTKKRWALVTASGADQYKNVTVHCAGDERQLPVSGTWGALAWSISADGVFTVSGQGDMAPFASDSERPWNNYKDVIKKAVFEEGVTGIAPNALTVCSQLTELRLPSTLKTIGSNAFHGNPALAAVYMQEGLEELGDGAFSVCTALKSIRIPDSVTKMGRIAFWRCEALETAVLGNGITELEDQAFSGCGSLRSVTLGSGLKRLGQNVFANAGLTAIVFPDGLESIGPYAFGSCADLTSVTLPLTVSSIGKGAFSFDTKLKTVRFPGTQTDWYAIRISGENDPLWNAIGYTMRYSGELESGLQWTLEGSVLTVSGQGPMEADDFFPWFEYASSIQTAIIEEGVTSIGSSAFSNCDDLRSIYIPLSVKSIGFGAINKVDEIVYPGTMGQWRQIAIDPQNAYAVTHRGIDPSYAGDASVLTRVQAVTVPLSSSTKEALYSMRDVDPQNAAEYKLSIELSTDGGQSWHPASYGNIPSQGIIICLPYPANTDPAAQDYTVFFADLSGGWSTVRSTEEADGLYLTIRKPDNVGIYWMDAGQQSAPADPLYSGSLKETGLSWRVRNGTLYISGDGKMPDFSPAGDDGAAADTPWYPVRDEIERILLLPGVTGIGNYAFRGLDRVLEVYLPDSLAVIGSDAFALPIDGRIYMSSREGYTFAGWRDASGKKLDGYALAAGVSYEQPLQAVWQKEWHEGIFTDVRAGQWYHDAVRSVFQDGLMVGMTDTIFSPGGSGTRAQVVSILYRLAGEPAVSNPCGFTDIPAGQWYTDAVTWAAENGIAAGYEDNTFRPNRAVTRQEFVQFLKTMAEYMGVSSPDTVWPDSYTKDFPDAAAISAWALPAENWSVAVGLQHGSLQPDGKLLLNPKNSVTRAELATYLSSFCSDIDEIQQLDKAQASAP